MLSCPTTYCEEEHKLGTLDTLLLRKPPDYCILMLVGYVVIIHGKDTFTSSACRTDRQEAAHFRIGWSHPDFTSLTPFCCDMARSRPSSWENQAKRQVRRLQPHFPSYCWGVPQPTRKSLPCSILRMRPSSRGSISLSRCH